MGWLREIGLVRLRAGGDDEDGEDEKAVLLFNEKGW